MARLVGLALLAVPGLALGQQTTVVLEAQATRLSVDDELQVRLRASGEYDEVTDLQSEGFDFRQSGHQTSVNLIGSQMTRTESWLFVGTPRRPGKYTIGPVVLRLDGQTAASSNALQIEVVGNDPAAAPGQTPQQATDIHTYAGQPVFVRPQLSTHSPYVGQPFVLTYELYWTRSMNIRNIRLVTAPKWGDLDVEDLLPKEHSEQTVSVEGRVYQRSMTQQVLLTSPSAGKVRVEGPGFRVELADLFDSKVRKVASPVLDIEVRPVPSAGRPKSYIDGNVGRLTLTGSLTRPDSGGTGGTVAVQGEAQTGERLQLEYVVSGDGNLLGLLPIVPPGVPGMHAETLQGRPDAGVQRTASGTEGKRTWQAVVSFARPGRYLIPALEWTAFDPFAEKFVTSSAGAFEVNVQGPVQEADLATPTAEDGSVAAGSATKPLVVAASARLRPIAATARLATTPRRSWVHGPLLAWLVALPWLGGLLLAAWVALQRRTTRAAPQRQRQQALKRAQDQLEASRSLGPDRGYAALRDAVATYLQTVAGLHPTGLTEHALADWLRTEGAEAAAVDQLMVELQHCDFARFAPGGDRAIDLEQTARRISEVLARLDPGLLAPRRPGSAPGVGAFLLGAALLLLPGQTQAATLDETFAAANRAYVAGQYEQAQKGYQALLEHDVPAPAIHYNLGNTLVQQKELGRAIGHYEQALRGLQAGNLFEGPDDPLRADVVHNLGLVRAELADRARKNHATLHVFDEAPELDVVLARAAPEPLLGALALLGGFGALALIALRVLRKRPGEATTLWTGVALCLVLHVASLAWLWQAGRVRANVVQAVVVQEDATLAPCVGGGETMGLPEGLLVRRLAELPDGRMEVRLPNGREGCLPALALYVER